MKLTNLKTLHIEMKKIGVSVETFDYSYNNQDCSVIFYPDYTNGFYLVFFKKKNASKLKLPIKKGYDLILLGQDFTNFWNFFEIGAEKGKFKIKDFYEHLNKKIPTVATKINSNDRMLIQKTIPIDDEENIFFKNLINWEKARIKNPNLNKGRDPKNLEKTKILYPNIYEEIKNFDISVAYTNSPIHDEEKIINDEINSLYN